MKNIITCVLLAMLVALTGCVPQPPVQPIITYTPANTTVPALGGLPPGTIIPGGGLPRQYLPYFDFANSVNLTAGEAKSIDVTLVPRNNGPAEFSVVFLGTSTTGPYVGGHTLPMPSGLEVSIESPIMAYPNINSHLAIAINTSAELPPGGYWLQFNFTFENLMQEPPWILITVAPAT